MVLSTVAVSGVWLRRGLSLLAFCSASINTVNGTGWQRPIGCLKLQVIFRQRATNYRALLQKMTYNDKASYGSSPPCSKYSIDLGRQFGNKVIDCIVQQCVAGYCSVLQQQVIIIHIIKRSHPAIHCCQRCQKRH